MDPTQELRDPPSPASLMRMAALDDALWDRDQIGSDLGHSGPSETRRHPSRLGHRPSPSGPAGGQEDGGQGDNGVGNGDAGAPGAQTRLRARRKAEHELVRVAHSSGVLRRGRRAAQTTCFINSSRDPHDVRNQTS